MTLIVLLLRWWRAQQRAIDLKILWPTCKREAEENVRGEDALGDDPLDVAKAMFAVHAFHDEAWLCLGEDEIVRRIDELV